MILRHFYARSLAFFLSLVCAINVMAAEQFVSFRPCSDMWQLKKFSVGFSQNEHSCVQLAANNLLADLEKEHKYDCVEVCVKKAAAAALCVYEKVGFTDTGYIDEDAPDCLNLMYHFT